MELEQPKPGMVRITGPLDFYCATPTCVKRNGKRAAYTLAGKLYCEDCGILANRQIDAGTSYKILSTGMVYLEPPRPRRARGVEPPRSFSILDMIE